MSYIVMATDECGTECRPEGKSYSSMSAATEDIPRLKEEFPEYRSIWAELFRDKEYYMRKHLEDDYDLA